eukprot:TRINITY_DN60884_c0_g1_i1.p1 TRINITY_DN60884_c0_g1~~TRINITY_DN60884_c0_g1_i1.p1  ORF type:complete len:749 (+),score=151.42 TRINITY_DN60884_c0_g1_i1:52-2247(+)
MATPSGSRSPRMSLLMEPLVPQTVSSRMTITGTKTHRLPGRVMWYITILTALAMALVNFFTILAIEFSVRFKFSMMQAVIVSHGLPYGIGVLLLISMAYSLIGVTLIECFAPSCGGSGLPENKCFLNGSELPGFYTKRTLRIRIISVILSNAAGFPVGREGPTVVIGSNVAFLISKRIARPHLVELVDFSSLLSGSEAAARVVDEERLADATRIACAVGGACGMAMIFNAPFGGFLYMFEEITSVSWPLELTFRVFVGTMCCAMVSYGLLALCGTDIFEFVIFAWVPRENKWTWIDVPLIIPMAALCGVLTSYHTRGCLFMAGVRQRMVKSLQRYQPWAKMSETVIYAGVCVLVSVGTALLATCEKSTTGGITDLQYVQFNCAEGEFNPIASLLVNTSHSSVKLLFSGENTGQIRHYAAILSFLAYYALNVGLTGLPVPGGAFTATMLLGGLFGRFVGEMFLEFKLIKTVSGIYAVVGSAAMLCGFKQMTLAVVLIVVECVNSLDLAPVVMLGVTISMWVNKLINDLGHDEEQIKRKRLPFLESEPPKMLDDYTALNLCDVMPPEAVLRPKAPVASVRSALNVENLHFFPVVDEKTSLCVGIISRPSLEAALLVLPGEVYTPRRRSRAFLDDPFAAKEDPKAIKGLTRMLSGDDLQDDRLPLDRLMDPTPLTIVEEMPAPRLYCLFSKAGERAACVVSRTGDFRGLISRKGLIDSNLALAEGGPIKCVKGN